MLLKIKHISFFRDQKSNLNLFLCKYKSIYKYKRIQIRSTKSLVLANLLTSTSASTNHRFVKRFVKSYISEADVVLVNRFVLAVRGSSETIRAACISNLNLLSKNRYKDNKAPHFFSYWLAGVIDADGCLLVSKTGYTSCEITVSEKEWQLVALIKHKLGGSIKKRSGAKALRWRLHNTPGMIKLVSMINGKLALEKRRVQLAKVCSQLKIQVVEGWFPYHQRCHSCIAIADKRTTKSIKINQDIQNNAWLAGFFEGDGCFHVNKKHYQLSVTLSQKDKLLLDKIACSMGGNVFYDKSWNGWLYSASDHNDIAVWIKYFSRHPLISWKQIQLHRFRRILLYKSRKIHLTKEGKPWDRFKRLVSQFSL